MGGALPLRNQRVVGVGGTAGLVHPSTGYMVARTMGAVPQLADRVVDEVEALKQRGRRSGQLLSLFTMAVDVVVFALQLHTSCTKTNYNSCTSLNFGSTILTF